MTEQMDAMKAALAQQAAAVERQQTAISQVEQLVRDLTALGIDNAVEIGDPPGLSITLTIHAAASPQQLVAPAPTKALPPPPKPAPVAKPKPNKWPKAKSKKTERWSEEEDERAIQMALAGKNSRQVADELGRPFQGTKWRLAKVLRGEIQRRREAQAKSPIKAEAPPPAPVVALPVAEPVRTHTVSALAAHLNALGHVAPWDAQLDLEMVELLATGTKAGQAAEILEIPKADICSRFKALCPEPTVENQNRLIEELRRRVAA